MEKKIEGVNNNGQLVVSSRQVAETFGKRHDKLLHEMDGKAHWIPCEQDGSLSGADWDDLSGC